MVCHRAHQKSSGQKWDCGGTLNAFQRAEEEDPGAGRAQEQPWKDAGISAVVMTAAEEQT